MTRYALGGALTGAVPDYAADPIFQSSTTELRKLAKGVEAAEQQTASARADAERQGLVASLMTVVGKGVRAFVLQQMAVLKARADAAEAELADVRRELDDLKARPPLVDKGPWRPGSFSKGDSVSHDGGLWLAVSTTAAKPGDGPDSGWRLVAKRGARGESAWETACRHGFKGSETEWLVSLHNPVVSVPRPSGVAEPRK